MLRVITSLLLIYLTLVLSNAFIYWVSPVWSIAQWTGGQRWVLLIVFCLWGLMQMVSIGKRYRDQAEPDNLFTVWHSGSKEPTNKGLNYLVQTEAGDIYRARWVNELGGHYVGFAYHDKDMPILDNIVRWCYHIG